MAGNVLDEFFVAIGLDPSGFLRGKKTVDQASEDLRENIVGDAKKQTQATKGFQDSLSSVKREALGLFLVFAGAATVKGFVGNILAGDAATGRLANNLGVATDKLSAWEQAVTRVGGSKGDIDGSMSSLSGIFQNYQLRGDLSKSGDLAGLGLSVSDLNDPTQAMLKLADASKRFSPREFSSRASALGIDQNTINLLEKGRGAVEGYLREAEKNGAVTERDAKAAEEMQSALANLTGQIQGAARPEITKLVEGLISFNEQTHAAGLVVPVLEGGIAAIGVAATIAYAPVALLAAGISAIIVAWKDWDHLKNMSVSERKAFDDRGAELRSKAASALAHGDIGGAVGAIWEGFSERAGLTSGVPATGNGGANSDVAQFMRAKGFTAQQAQGIAAGIHAEGGGLGYAANGAFGLGQWRGARRIGLMRRYGANPSRQQQLEYLAWEMQGGERQSAGAVQRASTADGALLQYVGQVMRPGNGAFGDIRRGRAYLGGDPRRIHGGGTTVHIHHADIHTKATDAKGLKRDVGADMAKRAVVFQHQTGVQP